MTNILSQLAQQAVQTCQNLLQNPQVQNTLKGCLPIAAKELERKWKEWFR